MNGNNGTCNDKGLIICQLRKAIRGKVLPRWPHSRPHSRQSHSIVYWLPQLAPSSVRRTVAGDRHSQRGLADTHSFITNHLFIQIYIIARKTSFNCLSIDARPIALFSHCVRTLMAFRTDWIVHNIDLISGKSINKPLVLFVFLYFTIHSKLSWTWNDSMIWHWNNYKINWTVETCKNKLLNYLIKNKLITTIVKKVDKLFFIKLKVWLTRMRTVWCGHTDNIFRALKTAFSNENAGFIIWFCYICL